MHPPIEGRIGKDIKREHSGRFEIISLVYPLQDFSDGQPRPG